MTQEFSCLFLESSYQNMRSLEFLKLSDKLRGSTYIVFVRICLFFILKLRPVSNENSVNIHSTLFFYRRVNLKWLGVCHCTMLVHTTAKNRNLECFVWLTQVQKMPTIYLWYVDIIFYLFRYLHSIPIPNSHPNISCDDIKL